MAALIAGAVLLVLNVAGVARYPGGPLREDGADGPLWLDTWPADWGNSPVGNGELADWATPDTDLVVSMVRIANHGSWPATIEHIVPFGVTGDLTVTAVGVRSQEAQNGDLWTFGPMDDANRTAFQADYQSLPVTIPPGSERQVAVIVRGPHAGPAGYRGLDVDYRVGPFAFHVVEHSGLEACLGSTVEERTCPEEE